MRTEIKPRYSMEMRVVKRNEQTTAEAEHGREENHHDD